MTEPARLGGVDARVSDDGGDSGEESKSNDILLHVSYEESDAEPPGGAARVAEPGATRVAEHGTARAAPAPGPLAAPAPGPLAAPPKAPPWPRVASVGLFRKTEDFDACLTADELAEERVDEEALRKESVYGLVRNLVPRSTIDFPAKVQQMVVDALTEPRPDVLRADEAHKVAEHVLVFILKRVRRDEAMLESYWALFRFGVYAWLFLVLLIMQLGLVSTDYTVTYAAIRDKVYGLSGSVVANDNVGDVRSSLSGWTPVEDFLDTYIDELFMPGICGNGICAVGEETPQWKPLGDESSSRFAGCAADCGEQITTDVNVTFFDAWKLKSAVQHVEAIIESGTHCDGETGTCYPIESWQFERPTAGWNVCHEVDGEFGVAETVCVFDADFFVEGRPFRRAELDPSDVAFGETKTVALYGGAWSLRYAFKGFSWTNPRTGAAAPVAFPAARGEVCVRKPHRDYDSKTAFYFGPGEHDAEDSAEIVCKAWGACPDAKRCACRFLDNVYACAAAVASKADARARHDDVPDELRLLRYDAPPLDPSEFPYFHGAEAVARWWDVKSFEGFEMLTPIEQPEETRFVRNVRVNNVADDADEVDGFVATGGSAVSLGRSRLDSSAASTAGLRLADVRVEPGATIITAVLRVYAAAADAQALDLRVRVEAVGDAAPFSTTSTLDERYGISSRVTYNQVVTQVRVPPWKRGEAQYLVDVRDLVQRVVDRGDWDAGNALAFIITARNGDGGGRRKIVAFSDADAERAPSLRIEYVRTETLEVALGAAADDVQELQDSGASFARGALSLGSDGGVSVAQGLRFPSLALQPGQRILSSHISFASLAESRAAAPGAPAALDLVLQVESADDALPYGSFRGLDGVETPPGPYSLAGETTSIEGPFDLAERAVSRRRYNATNAVLLHLPRFEAGSRFDTDDVSLAIATVLARPGWRKGAALAFALRPRVSSAQAGVDANALQRRVVSQTAAEAPRTTAPRDSPTLKVLLVGLDALRVTSAPSSSPSAVPTAAPSLEPTAAPSGVPTGMPTFLPSVPPTPSPSTAAPSGCDDRIEPGDLCVVMVTLDPNLCETFFCPKCQLANQCDKTCGLCDGSFEGLWSSRGNPSKDCMWVEDSRQDRCFAKSDDGTRALDGCSEVCKGITPYPTRRPTRKPTRKPTQRPSSRNRGLLAAGDGEDEAGGDAGDDADDGEADDGANSASPNSASSNSDAWSPWPRPGGASARRLDAAAADGAAGCLNTTLRTQGQVRATVAVAVLDSETGASALEMVSEALDEAVEVCLVPGRCYDVVAGETTLPFGWSYAILDLVGYSPSRLSFVPLALDGKLAALQIVQGGCSGGEARYGGGVSGGGGDFFRKEFDVAAPAAPDVGVDGRLRCLEQWSGGQPKLPSTEFTSCTRSGTYDHLAVVVECPAGVTHCWYIESTTQTSSDCNFVTGKGGCWDSLVSSVWPTTLAARLGGEAPPEPGPLAADQCDAIANVLFEGDIAANSCAGCNTDLCREQDPGWYSNLFQTVNSRSLVVSRHGMYNAALGHSYKCSDFHSGDGVCDKKWNHMGCGYDGGDCCVKRTFDSGETFHFTTTAAYSDESCYVPWFQTDAKQVWRYAAIVGGRPFATVPPAVWYAVAELLALQAAPELPSVAEQDRGLLDYAGHLGLAGQGEFMSYDARLDAEVPSLACPECDAVPAAADGSRASFRNVPFAVVTTPRNANGYYDWRAREEGAAAAGAGTFEGARDCASLAAEVASGALDLEVACGVAGDDYTLARQKCAVCWAGVPWGDSTLPRTQYVGAQDPDEPRLRYMTKPNVIIYGPIMTQLRVEGARCQTGRPFNRQTPASIRYLDYLVDAGIKCQSEKPSKAPFGMDATLSSDHFAQFWSQNAKDLFHSYDETEMERSIPFGFYGSSRGQGRDFPVYWDVNLNYTRARDVTRLAVDGGYFDEFTQQVRIDVVTQNREAPSQLLAVTSVVASLQPEGGVNFEWSVQVIDTELYDDTDDVLRLVLEALFIGWLAMMTIREVVELLALAKESFWGFLGYFSAGNVLDCALYGVGIVMVLHRVEYWQATIALKKLKVHYDVYAGGDLSWNMRSMRVLDYDTAGISDLQHAVAQVTALSHRLALYKMYGMMGMLLIVLGMLKALNFHPRFGIITRTIGKALGSLVFWFILQTAICLLYALLGVLLFRESSDGFGDAQVPGIVQAFAGFALLSLTGMYDPSELGAIPGLDEVGDEFGIASFSYYVTQIFYWSYMLLSFFIMFNALLAIIVSAYEEVDHEMKTADRDAILFAAKACFGASGVPGPPVPLRALRKMLEAWVGDRLDREISPTDSIDKIIERASAPPRKRNAAAHEVLRTRRMPARSRIDSALFSFKAGDDPMLALDRNLLSVVVRCYGDYYLSTIDHDKLLVKDFFSGAARRVSPLDRPGAYRFAVNVLARYGTFSDLDNDGVVADDEANAIRNLVVSLPVICDERRSPAMRLATVFNISRGTVPPPTGYDARPPAAPGRSARASSDGTAGDEEADGAEEAVSVSRISEVLSIATQRAPRRRKKRALLRDGGRVASQPAAAAPLGGGALGAYGGNYAGDIYAAQTDDAALY